MRGKWTTLSHTVTRDEVCSLNANKNFKDNKFSFVELDSFVVGGSMEKKLIKVHGHKLQIELM
jgi:hypothetical protein